MTFKELEQQYQETAPEKSATFMNFARKAWKSGEMSMAEVMNALARIADADTEECRIIGRKGAEMTYEQRQRLTMGAKLVAGLLVLLCESRSKNETRSRALLFLEYAVAQFFQNALVLFLLITGADEHIYDIAKQIGRCLDFFSRSYIYFMQRFDISFFIDAELSCRSPESVIIRIFR